MFSHIMVGTNDVNRSKTFYDATLGALGVAPAPIDGNRLFYRTEGGALGVTQPINGQPATAANGGTTCEDPPGLRDFGAMKLYLAYLRDPDGNKLCAVHYMG